MQSQMDLMELKESRELRELKGSRELRELMAERLGVYVESEVA